MGDLDVNLIREFARRPGFYDRSNPFYKDKLFTDRSWEEISDHLGYGVTLLKERMLQLRNRYNLEKRRLDNLSLDNPNKVYRSPWPLYQHLSFLSNHIRTRRSYKTMMTRSTSRSHGINANESSRSSIMAETDHSYPCPYNNAPEYQNGGGTIDVKHERCSDSDTPVQNEDEDDNDKEYPDPSSYLVQNDEENHDVVAPPATPPYMTLMNPPSTAGPNDPTTTPPSNLSSPLIQPTLTNGPVISVRNGEFLKRPVTNNFHEQQGGSSSMYSHRNSPCDLKRRRLDSSRGFAKFEAFGKFVSASLCDMPEQKALSLLEKFTIEIVLAFRDKETVAETREQYHRNHHRRQREESQHEQHQQPIQQQQQQQQPQPQQIQPQQQQLLQQHQPQIQPQQQQQQQPQQQEQLQKEQQRQPQPPQQLPTQQQLQQLTLANSTQQVQEDQQQQTHTQDRNQYNQTIEHYLNHVERQNQHQHQHQHQHKHKKQPFGELLMTTINT